jgi:hypothetical protein
VTDLQLQDLPRAARLILNVFYGRADNSVAPLGSEGSGAMDDDDKRSARGDANASVNASASGTNDAGAGAGAGAGARDKDKEPVGPGSDPKTDSELMRGGRPPFDSKHTPTHISPPSLPAQGRRPPAIPPPPPPGAPACTASHEPPARPPQRHQRHLLRGRARGRRERHSSPGALLGRLVLLQVAASYEPSHR